MTARRAPDGPNRLDKNARQSAFGGAMDGHLRSARPTRRRNIPGTPSSSASPTSGGQIYTVASGVTDVSPGNYLLDLSGALWGKDTDEKWVRLFEGQNSGRFLYEPAHVGVGPESDLLMGYGNGYYYTTDPSGASVFGANNLLPFGALGSGGGANFILGTGNHLVEDPDVSMEGIRFSPSGVYFAGSGNIVDVSDPEGLSSAFIYGSNNAIEAYRSVSNYIFGNGNSLDSASIISSISIFGRSNQYIIDGGMVGAAENVLMVGHSLEVTNASNAIIIGLGLTATDAYNSWVLGSNATLTGENQGLLVANSVTIQRDPTLGGSEETALILISDDGTPTDLTVDDSGILLVNGSPVTGGGSGIEWLGTWSSATAYVVDDVVEYNGSSYISILAGTNQQPDTSPTYWDLLAERGADGDEGDSAYDVAVANGFVGTESDWLDSLVGAEGDPGAPGAAGGVSRDTVSYTTASLADAASEDDELTGFPAYRPIIVEADYDARVTIYVNETYATADSARPFGTAPTGDHGVLLDVEVDGATPFPIPWVPTVYVVGTDPTWIRVTNISGSTQVVDVDITVLVDELP